MSDFEELSDREMDVLRCVVESGASNKEIASELSISHHTVKVHLRNIYAKLGVSSRTEAATIAIQHGLVTIPGLEVATPDPEPKPVPVEVESEAEGVAETAVSATPNPAPLPTDAAAPEPAPAEAPSTRNQLVRPFLLGGLLIGVLLLAALGLLWPGSPWAVISNEPTPIPFTETAIGDTRWSLGRPLPAPQAGMSVAAVGLTVYQIGGETAEGIINTTLAYNTSERQWQDRAAKPTAIADAGTAVLFGEIYVVGGRLANGQPTNVVEAYSPAENGWRLIAPLPQPVSGGLALADGSFLYLFGGWDGSNYLDTSFVYDPSSDSWRPLPPLAQPRAFAAGDALTGRLYVVGGSDGTAELDTCQYLDPTAAENGVWFDCPALLQPRAGAAAAVLRNRLYVIGGGQNNSPITYSEMYEPNSNRWQVVNTPVLENATSWSSLGVAVVESRLYALGGRLDGEATAATYVYAPFIFQTFIPAASGGG
jgi:DNA-binding CsgD family transcriptional regulator/N-acetylneuraminic acid mutarotase